MPHKLVSPVQRTRARALRHAMTEAEKRIWKQLRAHRFQGAFFRRQFPIGPYIVDFVCLDARLIVEIDGGQHGAQQAEWDAKRDAWLRAQGFVILRFWNNDVLGNFGGVLERIAETLCDAAPLSLTLPRKGGGNRPTVSDEQR